MADTDYALALSLQDEFSAIDNEETRNSGDKRKRPTSIVDDCWETIDPTPDIRELFLQFNDKYFDSKLSCCEVKWAPRMTLCAGVCCYEGRGGLCSIKLSMPLLKLRPRKDLVQTLLHEMIHAFLFVTHNNKDHDSHGPEFHKHMSRINRSSGSNITVYHNFHDEVDLYRQHWWRCNGPCQKRPPYYGMVKRAMNRAPAPRDPWWPDHQRTCGGTYHKIREPEDYGKKKRKKDDGINAENEATKDTPKIYDLWNKESGGKSHKTNSSDSSTNAKPNYSKTSSGNDINTGDLSTNAGGTKIDNFWRVENDDSSGKENDVQKINHAFTPFTGKGHVLGSVQSETSTISVKKQGNTRTVSKGRDFSPPVQGNGQDFQGIKLFLQNTGRLSSRSGYLNRIVTSTQSKSSKAIDITENDFVDDADIDIVQNTSRNPFIKGKESRLGTNLTTESNSSTLNEIEDVSTDTQQKVNSGTQLTIVDAFKNVGDKKVPVVVINETPTKSAVLASVQCPVCLLKVEETRINAHLDACLS